MTEVVTVRVLDREYTVGCPADQVSSLRAAALLLDKQMRDIRGDNKTVTLDRLAVLAALNIAHEFQQLKDGKEKNDATVGRTMGEMNRKLDDLFDSLPR